MPDAPDRSHPLRIYLLGGFRVERDGKAIPLSAWQRRGAARTIIKLLAVEQRHQIHREELLEVLWPGVDSESALNRLAKALHAARHAIEPELPPRRESSYIHLSDGVLALDICGVWIDAEAFTRLALDSLESDDTAALEDALSAYTGDLLPEDKYEDWTTNARETLAGLHERVQLVLAQKHLTHGAIDRAELIWTQVLARDATREEAHRGLMRLYTSRGARAQALRQYEMCREALEEELGAEPEPETEDLHREIVSGSLSPRLDLAGSRVPSGLQDPLPPAVSGEPRPAPIGRDAVIEIAKQDLEAAWQGTGKMVLVSGEPGIGKTSLMAHVARHAHERGVLVLWGASYAQEHVVPFGPLVEAVQGYLIGCSAERRSELARRYAPLTLLIPALAGENAPRPPSGSSDSVRSAIARDPQLLHGQIIASFLALFSELTESESSVGDAGRYVDREELGDMDGLGQGGRRRAHEVVAPTTTSRDEIDNSLGERVRRPLLLALDDLHAADAPTLSLLRQLAQSAGGQPWLILAAYRSEDVAQRGEVSRFLTLFKELSLGRRVVLGRLSRGDTSGLIRTMFPGEELPPELLDRVYALSLGNPLFTRELVRAMQEDAGQGFMASGAAVGRLPARVTDAVAGRLARLGSETLRVLELAAIKGMELELRTLLHAAEIAFPASVDQERLFDVLDQALAAEILDDRGEIYAFRHPLVRAAILQQIPSHRESRLHGAIAAAIEWDRPNDLEALAFHYSRSQHREKAIEYLDRAARRAELLFAYSEATSYLFDLIALLDTAGQDRDAARMRQRLGFVLGRMGSQDEALAELERAALVHREAGDLVNLGFATAQMADTHFLNGTPEQGIARISELVDRTGDSIPAAPGAALNVALASIYWSSGRYQEQFEATTRALEGLEKTDLESSGLEAIHIERIRRGALLWRGIALIALGKVDEGVVMLEGIVEALADDQDLVGDSRACGALARGYRELGDTERSERYARRAASPLISGVEGIR